MQMIIVNERENRDDEIEKNNNIIQIKQGNNTRKYKI